MQALIDVILPVFIVVGFGYLVVWRGLFSTSAVDGLMSYTQNFAIPCLLFIALIQIDLSQAYSLKLMSSFYIGAASGFALVFWAQDTCFAAAPKTVSPLALLVCFPIL